jgi:PTH1 family peptidyl-tRNA hydrolase
MIDEAIDESLRCTEMLMKDGLEKTVQRLHSFKAQA